jgi:ABC-type transport system involved in multi-copper enzyme maturation permease subunit
MSRMNLGPVFWWELRRVSRQWSFYAMRAVLVAGLLVGLTVMWWKEVSSQLDASRPASVARAGQWYFGVIVVGQLSMVLLAAPAATAGAFSTEVARGNVCLMLVAGLTPLEIILGTLAARILSLLGALACVVPVLALSSHLGGIDPGTMVRLEIVTIGCAVLGCTVALVVSLGAARVHEALVTTYVLLAGWVLGYPVLTMIRLTSLRSLVPGGLMGWLLGVNPYALAFGPLFRPGSARPGEAWALLGGTLALSLALAGLAAWRMRPAAQSTPGRQSRRRWGSRVASRWMGATLDSNPMLWRECRRQLPSGWLNLLWRFYAAGALLFSAMAVYECLVVGKWRSQWAGPFNGFQAAVGLLLLSVVTPAALAEERGRGGLEVLLSTPLSTRSLVLAKWWGHYRVVPMLALLPTIVAAAYAVRLGRWSGVALVAGTILAYGAAVTSLGIGLATWVPRLDRALSLSVAASVFVTIAFPILAVFLFRQDEFLVLALASASPMLSVLLLTVELADAKSKIWAMHRVLAPFWILAYSAIAFGLLRLTLATFDACLGRLTLHREASHPLRPSPAPGEGEPRAEACIGLGVPESPASQTDLPVPR